MFRIFSVVVRPPTLPREILRVEMAKQILRGVQPFDRPLIVWKVWLRPKVSTRDQRWKGRTWHTNTVNDMQLLVSVM